MRKFFRNAGHSTFCARSGFQAEMKYYLITLALCALALPITLTLPGAHEYPVFLHFLVAIAVSAWAGSASPTASPSMPMTPGLHATTLQ